MSSLDSVSSMISWTHRSLQPSPGVRLWSSHCSSPARIPPPQVVTHTLGALVQTNPASASHAPLQPSPSSRLPSSHPSGTSTAPLPHRSGISDELELSTASDAEDATAEEDGASSAEDDMG